MLMTYVWEHKWDLLIKFYQIRMTFFFQYTSRNYYTKSHMTFFPFSSKRFMTSTIITVYLQKWNEKKCENYAPKKTTLVTSSEMSKLYIKRLKKIIYIYLYIYHGNLHTYFWTFLKINLTKKLKKNIKINCFLKRGKRFYIWP